MDFVCTLLSSYQRKKSDIQWIVVILVHHLAQLYELQPLIYIYYQDLIDSDSTQFLSNKYTRKTFNKIFGVVFFKDRFTNSIKVSMKTCFL